MIILEDFEAWARSRSLDLEYRNYPGIGKIYECPRTLLALEAWQACLTAPAEDVCAAVDDPVAFIHPHTLRRFWGPGAKEEVGHVVNKEDPHEECLPLFLQPQRQMVLPERKEILQVWEPCDEVEQIRNEGFNECLSLWQAELNK